MFTAKKIDSSLLTFVVQGSVEDKSVVNCSLKSIRHFFPKSKIIISTWVNSDIQDLPFDKVIFSKDSCPVYKFYKHLSIDNNINRQLITTQNGLKEVKTKYAVKLRTDIAFKSSNLLKLISDIQKRPKKGFLNSRVIIPYNLSINPNTVKLVFHFNDWLIAGQTNDLKKIFNIPLMTIKDLRFFEKKLSKERIFTFKNWRHNNVKVADLDKNMISRYAPEQYIYKFAILRNTSLKLNHFFSFNSFLLRAHQNFVNKEILFKSSKDIGFINLKYKMNPFSDRVGFYTKIQCLSNSIHLEALNYFDLGKFVFKAIQLIKIILFNLSSSLYEKLKGLN